jgi:RNA polymerase sigma-70 factor (ECF subfamily)
MSMADHDAGLLEALRRDDPEGAEQLVERYGASVYRLALRLTGVKDHAEEVVEDVLQTVAGMIHTFSGESAFRVWIYRTATRAAYQKLRAHETRVDAMALADVVPPLDGDGRHFAPIDDWSTQGDAPALRRELQPVLTDAIEALPVDYRVALLLHDVEGVPGPEIAETLGMSLPAVKSRVHRSRLFLRNRLDMYFRR